MGELCVKEGNIYFRVDLDIWECLAVHFLDVRRVEEVPDLSGQVQVRVSAEEIILLES